MSDSGHIVLTLDAVLDGLVLEPVATDRYRAANVKTGHNVVFGGQLLAQSVVAALAGTDGKAVKTLHTVFARGALPDRPVEIGVERLHEGRALASSSVTISQGDRLCARSLVLLSADEPDLISHADAARQVAPPPGGEAAGGWQVEVVGDVDVDDPDAVGPPELDVWTRWPGAPDDPATSQALLAFGSEGFLIGTAMRPHKGVGQSQAHVTLSTGVVSHTITFHRPAPAAEWLLLAQRSPFAGGGRGYGHGDVFRRSGELVASFVQDSIIRPMKTGRPGRL